MNEDRIINPELENMGEERLENTLTRYLEELEKAFIRLGYLTPVNAIKELSK